MLGVKIVVLVLVISFVWHVVVNAMANAADPVTKIRLLDRSDPGPWWYTLDGFLIIVDLLGLVYIVAYFLFVFFK